MAENINPDFELDEIKAGVQAVRIANYSPSKLEADKSLKGGFLETLGDGAEITSCEPFYKDSDKKKGKTTDKDVPAGYVIVSRNAAGEQTISVSYHGTRGNNLQEIKHDLQATQTKRTLGTGEKISLHSGFNAEFEDSKSDLDEKLKLALSKAEGAKINFTGHSLGGAVATIAALHYCTNDKDPKLSAESVKLMTYGAPRVLQKDSVPIFNKILGKKAISIKIANDIVPRVPPKSLGYEHVGFKLKIGNMGHGGGKYRSAVNKVSNLEENIQKRDFEFVSADSYASKIMAITKEAFAKVISASQDIASSLRKTFQSSKMPIPNIPAGSRKPLSQQMDR